MKLRRPERPPPRETTFALIDAVFFLLVFFMLIGRMDATAPFDVVPPLAVTGRDMPAGGATLSVAPDGALALDGVRIESADLEDELARQAAKAPDLMLRINAHRDTELRHVLPLVGRAEALGLAEVVLVVTPPGAE